MTEQTELTAGGILELDPTRVKPFAAQPRKRFRGIRKLAQSIRAIGQITPIVVTRCEENGYDAELVDGERRLRACRLGRMPVKAVLEGDGDAGDRYVRSVAANFCRQGHDAVEIMEAVRTLREAGHTKAQIATIFGKTESWVQQYTILGKLAPEVLEQMKIAGDDVRQSRRRRRRRGRMTLSIALLLAPLPAAIQVRAMKRILAEGLSMAAARTHVYRLAAGEGVRVGARTSPAERFRAIVNAATNCHHVVERYLTMPGTEINSLIRGALPAERRKVAKRLDKLCESLLMLADAIHQANH